MRSQSPSVSLYGKIPNQGDFLRHNLDPRIARPLDAWFERALASLVRDGHSFAPGRLHFALRFDPRAPIAIGSAAPSVDNASRRYPLIAYALLDVARARHWPAIPRVFAGFLAECDALLERAATLDGPELVRAARAIATPRPDQLARAHADLQRELARRRADAYFARVYPIGPRDQAHYGLSTLGAASESLRRGARLARARIVISCPTPEVADAEFWMQLLAALLARPEHAPVLMWRPGRTLIAPGTPPPSMLRYHQDEDARGDQLWTLSTDSVAAIERARARLELRLRARLEEPSATLGELIKLMSRRP